MSLSILAYAVVFIICFATIIIAFRPSRGAKALLERLASIQRPDLDQAGERSQDGLLSRTFVTAANALDLKIHKHVVSSRLQLLLSQTHSELSPGAFILFSIGTGSTACVISFFAIQNLLLASLGFFLGSLIPCLWFMRKRATAMTGFAKALPDAIELMARSLRAGHSTQQAIEFIAEHSSRPLSTEFAQVHREQKFGIPFRVALSDLSSRIPSKELRFVVMAILVQKETGSDLIEILDRTTQLIRDRMRVRGEIQTHTAQGRLTGWILSLLPVFLLGVLTFLSPGYVQPLFSDPVGQDMLIAGFIMIVTGSLLIRHIVAVEI